jgi:hypothetical protein
MLLRSKAQALREAASSLRRLESSDRNFISLTQVEHTTKRATATRRHRMRMKAERGNVEEQAPESLSFIIA